MTKAAYARRVGVTQQAVGQAGRAPHGRLYPAMRGNRIDPDDPAAVEFERSHKGTAAPSKNHEPRERPPREPDDVATEDIEELKATKLREEIIEKRLKNREMDGSLVSRDFIEKFIFAALDELHRRLLTDASRTIARSVHAAAKAGEPLEESERLTGEIIGKNLKKAEDAVKRHFRSLDK